MKAYIITKNSKRHSIDLLKKAKLSRIKHLVTLRDEESLFYDQIQVFQVFGTKKRITNLFCEDEDVLQVTEIT